MEKWLEVFKAGEYPQGKFSENDLDQIVQNFQEFYQPPVVIGHPKDDSPAWGWVKAVKRQGKKLLVKIGDLVPEFLEFLKNFGTAEDPRERLEETKKAFRAFLDCLESLPGVGRDAQPIKA